MKKAVAIWLLLLAMSVATYADGIMGDPFAPPPQAATSTAQTGTEPAGSDMGNGGSATEATTTETALSLLPTLLALF